jgi:hypothetical protein
VKQSTKTLAALATVALFAACNQARNLDEMHDATAEMRDQTRDMNKQMHDMGSDTKALGATTKDMAAQTQVLGALSKGLDEKTAELYDVAKQGAALKTREDELNSLLEAQDPADKVSRASKYFMSFEYQIWSGIGQDSEARRIELATSAAREFMREIQGFVRSGQTEVDPFATPQMGVIAKGLKGLEALATADASKLASLNSSEVANREESLNSLAVTMHILNRKQEELLGLNKNIKELSILSMVQEALSAKADIETGRKQIEDYPGYVKEILVYEDVAVLLLQARQNYLGAMALARVSKIREDQTQVIAMNVGTWTMNLSTLNVVTIREVTRYLKGAVKIQDFLQALGVKPMLNKNLKRMLMNAQLDVSATNQTQDVKSASIAEFMTAMNGYRSR